MENTKETTGHPFTSNSINLVVNNRLAFLANACFDVVIFDLLYFIYIYNSVCEWDLKSYFQRNSSGKYEIGRTNLPWWSWSLIISTSGNAYNDVCNNLLAYLITYFVSCEESLFSVEVVRFEIINRFSLMMAAIPLLWFNLTVGI